MNSYFSNIETVSYKNNASYKELSYKFYDPNKKLFGKTMEEHLNVAVCAWHNICWEGNDAFGNATRTLPWKCNDKTQESYNKIDALFELIKKLQVRNFTFHDIDLVSDFQSIRSYEYDFRKVTEYLSRKMSDDKINLLWGTANLFSNKIYQSGASTNPNPEIFAFAAAQVKHALEATHSLKGKSYVLWNGRDGYDTLLNTDLKREKDNYAKFLSMVVDHKHKIGFKGDLLIEPKPCEPTKHQYDYDTETVYGFLSKYDLDKEFKVNIETNHATLAGHSFLHEVEMAHMLDCFGSIDINRGDPQNGWDTDQFPNSVEELSSIIYTILTHGGFKNGGFNFDVKLRRQSFLLEDILYGHVSGIDVLAKSLLVAEKMIKVGILEELKNKRYKRWSDSFGLDITKGTHSLDSLEKYVKNKTISSVKSESGREEMLEKIITNFIYEN
jgi:xylose isomerase